MKLLGQRQGPLLLRAMQYPDISICASPPSPSSHRATEQGHMIPAHVIGCIIEKKSWVYYVRVFPNGLWAFSFFALEGNIIFTILDSK